MLNWQFESDSNWAGISILCIYENAFLRLRTGHETMNTRLICVRLLRKSKCGIRTIDFFVGKLIFARKIDFFTENSFLPGKWIFPIFMHFGVKTPLYNLALLMKTSSLK